MLCLQAVTRKTRVLDVVYNASNNELVRSDASIFGGNCISACLYYQRKEM